MFGGHVIVLVITKGRMGWTILNWMRYMVWRNGFMRVDKYGELENVTRVWWLLGANMPVSAVSSTWSDYKLPWNSLLCHLDGVTTLRALLCYVDGYQLGR